MFEPEEEWDEEAREDLEQEELDVSPAEEAPGADYEFQDDYRDSMYSDAHYVPADESTEPPRYYTPPERSPRAGTAKGTKKSGGFVKTLCLCLVCALLGGLIGSAVTGSGVNKRLAALEERTAQVEQAEETHAETAAALPAQSAVSTISGMALSDLYDQACQQVVGITTDVTFSNFFGMTSSAAVTGSGFILSEDGYILTNYHVIEYADKGDNTATVITHDGTRYDAVIVGTEPSNDIAVLKIDATGLTPATLGDSDKLAVGDEVHPVGNPLGELEFSMTNGRVSALDREITTEANSEAINMFQMDAAVNSGNSGGPVYNNSGEVIGVVTAKYSDTGVEGIGFAIPINDAAKIADDLITKGYVTGKAYMGLSLEEQYNAMYAQYYGWPLGAYVHSVESGSAAEKAGIQTGDIITRLGDTPVESISDLKAALKQFSAGDTAELELYRADKSVILSITFDEAKPSKA